MHGAKLTELQEEINRIMIRARDFTVSFSRMTEQEDKISECTVG